jgi:hypothetical protein
MTFRITLPQTHVGSGRTIKPIERATFEHIEIWQILQKLESSCSISREILLRDYCMLVYSFFLCMRSQKRLKLVKE